MIRLSIFALFVTQGFFIQAQKLDQFYSSGFEPIELNQNSTDRFKKLYDDYLKKYGDSEQINEKAFVYEHNYFLDRLNKSGSIFYGDEISTYLNDLKNFIIDDTLLRSGIKIYLTDFPQVNAFTNDFGNIYVNIASIAKLNSEEELLYLLAHEIGHILKRHSRESKIYSNELRSQPWSNGEEENAFSEHAFSRKQELAADSVALDLLVGKIKLSNGISLMKNLEKSSNPIFSGQVNLDLLTGNNNGVRETWELMSSKFTDFVLLSEVQKSKEHSTHPSIEERIKKMNSILSRSSDKESSYSPTGKFETCQKLSRDVLMDTYIENSMFIAALDLVLKYRENLPNDVNLIRRQINILALLAQDTWHNTEFDRIINSFGNSCDDEDYLRFRQIILSMSNEDLNVFAYNVISSLEEQISKDSHHSHAKKFTFLLLQRNRPDLLEYNDGLAIYTTTEWSQDLNTVVWNSTLSTEDTTSLAELKEKGYLVAELNKSHYFLKSFFIDVPTSEEELVYLADYQKEIETSIIPQSELNFFEVPKALAKLNLNGVFLKSPTFDPDAKTALYQSDNFYFRRVLEWYASFGKHYTFDFEQSLRMDDEMYNVHSSTNTYSEDFSNAAGENISVNDNYIHKLIGVWLQEREDVPVYSKVEDKLFPILKAKGIKYITYRVCVVSRNKGFSRKSYSNFYEIYYDIDTGMIAYIGKIGSKQRFNKYHLQHFNYLSNHHKKTTKND